MKVIVVQQEALVLSMLKNAVNHFNPGRANEILFTTSTTKVLDEVKDYKDVLVIAGLKLDSLDGIELAAQVKSINPRALFYLFSSVPKHSKDVDGHIFKYGGNEIALAKILARDFDVETARTLLATITGN